MFQGARILVAPLDWGLGHAARCVPVVRALLEADAVPVLGADKAPLALLREEFPALEHVRLPGLEVRYSAGPTQAWTLAKQLPGLMRQPGLEQRAFLRLLPGLRLQAIISDQRFGIRAAGLPSVLITHQVFPFTPFAQSAARRINRWHLQRFHRCWIPDHAAAPGLAGELSHGPQLPGNARYIDPLSRFTGSMPAQGKSAWRTVVVASGPEPQRGLLVRSAVEQLRAIEGQHIVLAGQPGSAPVDEGNVRVVGHLPAEVLKEALLQAELVVSRTGYTTLMDLEAIGRGALLVPTPGQPEQEYLGRLHGDRGVHMVQAQQGLDIRAALHRPPGRRALPVKDDALWRALTELAQWIAKPTTA